MACAAACIHALRTPQPLFRSDRHLRIPERCMAITSHGSGLPRTPLRSPVPRAGERGALGPQAHAWRPLRALSIAQSTTSFQLPPLRPLDENYEVGAPRCIAGQLPENACLAPPVLSPNAGVEHPFLPSGFAGGALLHGLRQLAHPRAPPGGALSVRGAIAVQGSGQGRGPADGARAGRVHDLHFAAG